MHAVHIPVNVVMMGSRMDPLITGVRALRKKLGESQQKFAIRLGLSLRAIANYEKDRRPTGMALAALSRAAEETGASDLKYLFMQALIDELGLKNIDFRLMSGSRKGDEISGVLMAHLRGKEVEYAWAFFDMLEELRSAETELRTRAEERLTNLMNAVNADAERGLPDWAKPRRKDKV